jgi:hypothetical protein
VLEEQVGADPQEIQAHEVPEAKEPGEEPPECVDHQASSFERGKSRSISLPTVCKSLILRPFMFDALIYRSCLQTLLHIYYLTTLVHYSCSPILSLGPS